MIDKRYLGNRDYIQFSRYFGDNPELFEKLKPLKEEAEVSWEDITKLKWSDIDLENGVVHFPIKGKKKSDRADLEI